LVIFIGLNGRELTAVFGSTFRFNVIRYDTLPRTQLLAQRAILASSSRNRCDDTSDFVMGFNKRKMGDRCRQAAAQ
jgi:hypothetical protein